LQFAEKNPDVIAAMFNNAHKFVPQVTVGQTGDNVGGMISALLGEMLSRNNPQQPPATPQR
jgi:hypothetical protein